MTATLAAELDTRAAHMDKVRAEYEHTKADHARVDGCGRCGVGFVEGRSTGWDYDPDGTPAFCQPCVRERKRWLAQMFPESRPVVASNKVKGECVAGHKMTPENTYVYATASGRTKNRCRACGRRRNKAWRAKDRAVS